MKTIIVYYSMEENTAYVAKRIADHIGADTLRLYPKKAYPDSGFRKFMWGGMHAVMAEKPALEPYEFCGDDYERVIIGFPVWASNMAPPLRTFIRDNDITGKSICAFACQAGNYAEKAFIKLKSALGISEFENEMILVDPKSKPSEENEQKIEAFCDSLKG